MKGRDHFSQVLKNIADIWTIQRKFCSGHWPRMNGLVYTVGTQATTRIFSQELAFLGSEDKPYRSSLLRYGPWAWSGLDQSQDPAGRAGVGRVGQGPWCCHISLQCLPHAALLLSTASILLVLAAPASVTVAGRPCSAAGRFSISITFPINTAKAPEKHLINFHAPLKKQNKTNNKPQGSSGN